MNLWEIQGWLYDTMFLIKPHAELVTNVAGRLDSSALVLDAGCGSGRLGLDTDANVVGIDFSSTMLRQAREREASVVQGSLLKQLPFAGDSFDQIVSINVVYALGEDYIKALSEMYRVLKPGGKLYLANPITSALLPLLKEHFQKANGREIVQTLLRLPRFVAWGGNLAVRGLYESSNFKFLPQEELEEALTTAGFSIKSVEPAYAGIDRLFVAEKE